MEQDFSIVLHLEVLIAPNAQLFYS